MKRKKLVIISHTEHYKGSDGIIRGWGATINEVNYLADYWEEIVHIACLHNSELPKSALPYTKKNIQFVAIPPYGGKTIVDKISILFKIPKIIQRVVKNIKNASEVQLRLPTGMGVFLLPLFSFFLPRKYTFWVKYAGNWNQKNPPISYAFQKWWLKNNFGKCKVTINGFWKNQPEHCISFENPCLTTQDIINGKEIISNKNFNTPFTLCFVGRLDDAKGVSTIIESLKGISLDKIDKIHFIGDGKNLDNYKKESSFLTEKVFFHGFQNSEKVHQLLAESHFFLLPSKSEGFPKVIAEACCYGTIPIVSDVGSITHYVNNKNGFIWNSKESISYSEILKKALNEKPENLKYKSENSLILTELFTFENYINSLEKFVLKNYE